jgi:DnaJ-class molecular chaperone
MFNIKPNTGEATMTLAQALINTELASNETRANKFLRNANELLDLEATIVQCPNEDCYNGCIISYCDCFNNPKCSRCNGKGVAQARCPTCKGEGEVLMHTDGRIEVLI